MISSGGGGRLGGGVDAALAQRIPLLGALIALVFGIFLARLFQLQLIDSDDLRQRSQRNSVRTIRLEAKRGDILDRQGRIIATTRPDFGLVVMPNELREPDRTFAALGTLLDAEHVALREKVGTAKGRKRFLPVRLIADLSGDERTRIEAHRYALQGVFTDLLPRRDYVAGELASHVLGYLGEIRRDQLEKRRFAGYRQGEVIGQAGVEATLEAQLRGSAGGRNVVVDVAGREREKLDEIDPVPGGTVTLTLDLDLQHAAEKAFLPDVLGERAKMGGLVALDVNNGDVLALVSKPAFDPNDFAGGIDSQTWKRLSQNEWRPIQNRAIAGQYPPGSTYKPIVAAAALEDALIDPAEPVFCPGSFRLGRRTYRCWKRGGHGWVDMHDAIVQSCDVYFYELGLTVGIDRLAFFARGFNVGRKSGIPLPHEQPGLVPTTAWKEQRFGEPWIKGETVSAAIGQGFNLMTPLQLALAYSAIANGGVLWKPRLVLLSRDPDGNEVQGPPPEQIGTLPVAAKHLARLRTALEAVVHETGGTGGRARVPDVRVAGKTGTSQVVGLRHTEGLEEEEVTFRHRDHAWFVGFAPAEAPEIVVAALVEHGGHGGSAAAPAVRAVLARYFEKRNVGDEPQEPEEEGLTVAGH